MPDPSASTDSSTSHGGVPDTTAKCIDRRLSIAPMLDWTDRYCRYFLRLITRQSLLYTEMVTTGAILHGDRARFLDFDSSEHPLALQLGGSEPGELARCAALAEQWGYDEINLPLRQSTVRQLRRLSHGDAASGGRLHQGDARRRLHRCHRETPHRCG